MQTKRFITSLLKWLAAIVLLVGGVMGIRYFCIESYRLSTNSMEEALFEGDCILVNKLPGFGDPKRGRVMLFTSPLRRDSATSPLFLSRCIGMPGDTIRVNFDGYSINNRSLPRSPRALAAYFVAKDTEDEFFTAMQKLKITHRKVNNEPFGISLRLTSFEAYQLREELSEEENHHFINDPSENYTLIVPRKGYPYRLNAANLMACKEAILTETNGKAVLRDGKLYLKGKEIRFFFFRQNYYWMLSDNTGEAIDSRHLGFVPEDHLIGNAWFCWMSKDKQRIFKPVH